MREIYIETISLIRYVKLLLISDRLRKPYHIASLLLYVGVRRWAESFSRKAVRNSLIKDGGFYFCRLIRSCLQMNCDKHSPCSSNLHRCYIQLSDKLNNSRFFIESFLWTLRGQTTFCVFIKYIKWIWFRVGVSLYSNRPQKTS